MYQAILTAAFAHLLQQYDWDLSRIPKNEAALAEPLIEFSRKHMISLEPVFPGISDPELFRYCTVSLLKKLSPKDLSRLQSCTVFESFYQKPADELPM
jgi:hypothetical protein